MFTVTALLAGAAVAAAVPVQNVKYVGGASVGESKLLVPFGTDSSSRIKWEEENDPVMGGQSYGNWTSYDNFGRFQGETKDVPFLKAPGFCSVVASRGQFELDASSFLGGGLVLNVSTSTPEYTGFKICWGAPGVPRHHDEHGLFGSFKANFTIPSANTWSQVVVPFTDFSWDWSDFTGNCFTKDPDGGFQHECCTAATPDKCPTATQLSKVDYFQIWSEGVAGVFQLDISSISAYSN